MYGDKTRKSFFGKNIVCVCTNHEPTLQILMLPKNFAISLKGDNTLKLLYMYLLMLEKHNIS